MSKLTFRANDDLVARLESLEASKSQVIREALRQYLDRERRTKRSKSGDPSLRDALNQDIEDRFEDRGGDRRGGADVNITLRVPNRARSTTPRASQGNGSPDRQTPCPACGEVFEASHEYCPYCGAAGKDERCDGCDRRLRDEWMFCPGCGRRTPPPDVLDRS